MVDLFEELDFSKEIEENPELADHIRNAAQEISTSIKNEPEYTPPSFDRTMNHIVIIAGMPCIPSEKAPKLVDFFKMNLKKLELADPENFLLESRGTNTSGIMLLEFPDAEAAKIAAEKLNGFAFDKNHTLVACTNDEFDQITRLESEYKAPNIILDDALQSWLYDERLREQFLIKTGDNYYLNWFDHVDKKAQSIFSSKTFETTYGKILRTSWSRNGSYLITVHEKGFALWGANNFSFISFFNHNGVKNIEFSPNEEYVLSHNGTVAESKNTENFIVWRVATNQKLRSFKSENAQTFTSYKWSFDGSYIASCGSNLLNVYELPSMLKITDPATSKRASLAIPNIQQIEWAPTKNLLLIAAYPNQSSTTTNKSENWGKVFVLEFSREEGSANVNRRDLKWKTITWEYNNVKIYWEPTSLRVVLVFNKLKGKKGSTVLQIGEIGSQTISIEEHEFNDVKCVNIDDEAKKIAIVIPDPAQTNVQSGTIRYNVDIYRIDEQSKGKVFQKVGSLTDKTLSHVVWAVNGTFFALVNTDKMSANIGFLEFAFIKSNQKGEHSLEVIKNHKIPYMIYAAWDPSGKSLVTFTEKGHYIIWNGYGEPIYKDNLPVLNQILWRPKPRVVLPAPNLSKILKDFKKVTEKYEQDDDKIINAEEYAKKKVREEQTQAFVAYLSKKRTQWQQTKQKRVGLLGFDEDYLENLVRDEIVESKELVELKK